MRIFRCATLLLVLVGTAPAGAEIAPAGTMRDRAAAARLSAPDGAATSPVAAAAASPDSPPGPGGPAEAAMGLAAGPTAAASASAGSDTVAEPMARGEAAWNRRAEGHQGPQAAPGPIEEAVAAFSAALARDPGHLLARGRLLQALYFQAEYTLDDPGAKLAHFERARELAEEGIDLLAARVGGRDRLDAMEPEAVAEALADEPDARWIVFWSAAHWGLWGRETGKLKAARQGVARKVRDYATVTILLDETFLNAGGHRVLGRLHTEAPKIPFITGWVDRETAVRELERAVALAPNDLLSRLYLVEALLEFRPDRRSEALALLRDLLKSPPDPQWLVEEEAVLRDARALAARLGL